MTDAIALLVPALAMALLHFLWQGALVGLLAALGLSLLRNAPAQARYALACLALLACALLPFANLWMALAPDATTQPWPVVAMPAAAAATETALPAWVDATHPGAFAFPATLLPWVVVLWAGGALLLSVRMACGAWWLRGLQRGGRPAPGEWQACVDRLATCFGITRPVAVRMVDAGDSPLTTGWWRPMIWLPAGLVARMPADLLEALVAHELAHIRRHDYLVNLLQHAVEALLFYHPVVWWLSQRIRIERELVADDIAARVTGEPRRLAIALSRLDRLATARPAFTTQPALAAHGGQLMSRIRQLVKPERRAIGTAVLLPAIGLATIGMAFYAQARLSGDSAPDAVAAPQAATASTVAAPVAAGSESAAMAAPRPAAGPEPRARVTINGDDGPSYAVIRNGEAGFRMSGHLDDVDVIRAAQRAVDGDFVWFRREGKAWIVQDPATLARVHAATRRTDASSAKMRALEERMRPHSDRMSALGKQMDALQQDMDPGETREMRAASERMDALSRRMQSLADEQLALVEPMIAARGDEAKAREHAAKMEALSARQEALHAEMAREHAVIEAAAARMEAQAAPMEALAREMDAASEPMEGIGQEMEIVGKQLEREANIADAEIRAIIDAAYAAGLATPAPAQQ